MEISIRESCVGCGLCSQICPAHIFGKPQETEEDEECGKLKPSITSVSACIECGHCVCTCPAEAIEHSSFPKEKLIPLQSGWQPDWEAFRLLAESRRSVRHFKKEKIAHEALARIVSAAEMAPTACNARRVHWTVVTNDEILRLIWKATTAFLRGCVNVMDSPWAAFTAKLLPKSELGKNYARLPMMKSLLKAADSQDLILYGAPALLIAHTETQGGRFAEIDAQLAIQNATLAATALGLGTFYVGFVTRAAERNPVIPKILQIPKDHKIAGGMAVGIPAVSYHHAPKREYPEASWLE